MEFLGVDLAALLETFPESRQDPCIVIEVPGDKVEALKSILGPAVRRSYISDARLHERKDAGNDEGEVIAARLPNPGSTMSGDFGEIITAIVHAVRGFPQEHIDPKKWRLREARNRSAPFTDVVQMVVPYWPTPTGEDRLLATEVKAKATNGTSTPIESAIADSQKDKRIRLSDTLVWLRERMVSDVGGVEDITREHLDRFIEADRFPDHLREFYAVAVVSDDLIDAALSDVPSVLPADHTLMVISIPGLKELYEVVYSSAKESRLSAGPVT